MTDIKHNVVQKNIFILLITIMLALVLSFAIFVFAHAQTPEFHQISIKTNLSENECWRNAAKEFLKEQLSLIVYSWREVGRKDLDSGIFYIEKGSDIFVRHNQTWVDARQNWEWARAESLPLFSIGGRKHPHLSHVVEFWYDGNYIFDRDGELIDEPPFIGIYDGYWGTEIARGFRMFYLDGEDIPLIVVRYTPIQSFGSILPFSVLYKFIDGVYTEVGNIPALSGFYHNENGELIVFMYGGGIVIYEYNRLKFTDDGIELEFISGHKFCEETSTWLWYPSDGWERYAESENNEGYTIFGTNKPITRITNLWELEYELITYVRQSFGIIQEEYYFEAFVNRPLNIFEIGETFSMYYLLVNYSYGTEKIIWDLNTTSVTVSDSEVILVEHIAMDAMHTLENRLLVTALSEGTSNIIISDTTTGAELIVSITIIANVNPPNRLFLGRIPQRRTLYTIPQSWGTSINFSFDGFYVNSFRYIRDVYSTSVSFNIFNSRDTYGTINIYDEDGEWVESTSIDKFVKADIIWNDETTLEVIRNAFRTRFCFTAPSYSRKTQVAIYVPSNGHFTISRNIENAPIMPIYEQVPTRRPVERQVYEENYEKSYEENKDCLEEQGSGVYKIVSVMIAISILAIWILAEIILHIRFRNKNKK